MQSDSRIHSNGGALDVSRPGHHLPSMKAAVYYENGGPEVLRYEEVPEPACPPDGVLVDVEVVSIEGGDTHHRALTPFTDRPHIVGYQCAGTVREVGPNVASRKVGDRVVALGPNGSHAEVMAAKETSTWPVPAGADLTTVACVPVAFGTAHEALFALGQLTKGQRVLIQAGAGGVGLAAIQLAKAAGAEVLATASSDEKLERVREFGATHLINYKTGSFGEAITKAIGPNSVDLVIDTVGGKTLQESVDCLRYRGRIISLGVLARDFSPFNPIPLWGKNASVVGLSLLVSRREEQARTYGVIADCIARVASGELRVVVAEKYALADAAKAHAHSEQRSLFGRVVMLPRGR